MAVYLAKRYEGLKNYKKAEYSALALYPAFINPLRLLDIKALML